MLEAREISVWYGQRAALKNISLSAQPGVLTAILGPNGAGKSTLMRALNGGIKIQSGRVLLDEIEISRLSRTSVAKRVGVVAQESELRFPVTVTEFVLGARYATALPGSLGWETVEDIKIAIEALQETSMHTHASRMMNELSGGERQRAVLARALATEASILLLDEPTANLDLAHQASMLNVVSARCKHRGASALIVTHDINLAAEFADKVLLLKNGSQAAFGSPDEVITEEVLEEVFEIRVIVDRHPISGAPRVTPVHSMVQ